MEIAGGELRRRVGMICNEEHTCQVFGCTLQKEVQLHNVLMIDGR